MADIGFIPGFIGVGIDIAIPCRKELSTLQDVVREIEPIITHIQQYHLQINKKRGISTSHSHNNVSVVNVWLKRLDALLLQTSQMAQQCTVFSFNIFSRYQTIIEVANMKSNINNHLKSISMIQLGLTHDVLLGLSTPRSGKVFNLQPVPLHLPPCSLFLQEQRDFSSKIPS